MRLRDLLVLTGLLAVLLLVFGASTARAGCPYGRPYAYTAGVHPVPYRMSVTYRPAPVVNYRLAPSIYAPSYVPLPVAPLPRFPLPAVYYWQSTY